MPHGICKEIIIELFSLFVMTFIMPLTSATCFDLFYYLTLYNWVYNISRPLHRKQLMISTNPLNTLSSLFCLLNSYFILTNVAVKNCENLEIVIPNQTVWNNLVQKNPCCSNVNILRDESLV